MTQQMKSTPHFRRLLTKSKQDRQYEILQAEYERIDVLDDQKIKIRTKEVRLKKLKSEIEEINKFHYKKHRLNTNRSSSIKKDERLEKIKKSRDLGQFFSKRNCTFRREPKSIRREMLQDFSLNANADSFATRRKAMFTNILSKDTSDCINLQIGPGNNANNNKVLALSENVHFMDLGTIAIQKWETGPNTDASLHSLPEVTGKLSRAVNNWRLLAIGLTRNYNLCTPICSQVKIKDNSLNKLIPVVSKFGPHQFKNEKLSQPLQSLEPTYENLLAEGNDFNNLCKKDSKHRGAFSYSVGNLRQIFEHEN